MSYLLGVDVGTTSVKCVIFDQKGRALSSCRSEYEILMPQPEFMEVEAETYWNAFKESLKAVLNESQVAPQDISGIGVSSQGETFVAMDRDGKPVRRAIVWLDNRSKEEAELIKEEFGVDKVYRITGQNEIIPMWTATKIFWLKRNEPEVFRKVYKYLLLEDYIIFRLTGEFVTDYSVVCSTILFDISKRKWWGEILDFIGLSEEQLPELKPSGTPVGNVTLEAARDTGLSTKTLVSTGAYDHAAGAVGVGNIEPGVVTETTGGALAIVATVDRVILDRMRRIPCHYHAVEGRYFLQPFCPTAGAVLKWYRDNFGLLEMEAADRMGIDPYDLLTLEASKSPPGSDGLLLLPHFAGAASPEFNPNAKGVLFGLMLHHKKSHIIRSIMESIAYMLRRNIEVLEELGVNVKEVRSIGGGARSRLWNQIKADVLQKPIITVHTEENSALGVAILAGLATGVFSSIAKASESMVSIKERFTPSEANKDLYNGLYGRYVELYNRIGDLF
ncbi:xylulokinase [Candidatus Bathyarchaeota archaeon]|nr:xylulokinase [Candidatus Bathyarchaeota archaeon]